MGNARRILDSSDIIIKRAEEDRLSVVVSAVAGVSNALQAAIDASVTGTPSTKFTNELKSIHSEICSEIQSKLPGFNADKVMDKLNPYFEEIQKLLDGVAAFGECPDTIYCRIMGMGELMSSPIMEGVLLAKGQSVMLMDSRKFVFTTGNQKEGEADYAKCADACRPFRDGERDTQTRILLFQGFICSWTKGTGCEPIMGLLGRNGSDFSAAIIGASLRVKRVEFWTDVDGVFTADPRIVKDAVLVDDMTYEEAMELSFFGSKVLHPKTLAPLQAKNIEAWSLNSHNPSARGTRIGKGPFKRESPICGISCLKNVSMISVSGTGMKGRKGMASRIFAAVGQAGISILLITQSSSEYTITFCVRDSEANKVQDVLNKELELEINDGLINKIEVQSNCAVVSIVGDGMIQNRGIAGKFLDALASQDINNLAIAQGSSERCISSVIQGDMGDTAVRVINRFFFNAKQSIEVFAFGAGTIGGTLIDQIASQHDKLLAKNVDIKVMCITTIDGMYLNEEGIDLSTWRETMKNPPIKFSTSDKNVNEIIEFVKRVKPLNPVFVDCTASYDLPERYLDLLNAGMSIATPNKRANSMNIEFYRNLRETANKMNRRFLYETNVGAGLPIIDTLQNLFKSGDALSEFNGIMSGSLSYIFGKLDEGVSFSEAVLGARELRYTEPDPRDDLNGMDVARKALIIARESGMDIELSDITMHKVFPDSFNSEGTVEEFLKNLPQVDEYFAKKIADLKKEGKVLRMGATIKDGKVSVGMMEVTEDNPLYGVRGGENAFVFYTERYQPIPLTVRGYGAGAGVTAAGVFGDILRTVSFN